MSETEPILEETIDWPDILDYSIFDLVLPSYLSSVTPVVQKSLKQVHERVKLKLAKEETIRNIDKLAFVVGVSMIWTCSFLLGRFPHWVPHWYATHLLILMSIRWRSYKSLKWHYFCFDLCYYTNLLLILWLFVFPASRPLYLAVFALSMGPVSWAILAWRNSMVFHSLDKVTSLFIHLSPPIVLFSVHSATPPTNATFGEMMFYGLTFYTVWQVLYYLAIIHVNGSKVRNKQRVTSYSWLLDSEKKSLISSICSVFGPRFRIPMFLAWQFVYAFLTMMPAVLYFWYWHVFAGFVVAMLTLSIWNGANFYIEIFRYQPANTSRKIHRVKDATQ